jgi:site-specific recombinase XerD
MELLDKYLNERLPLENSALFIGRTGQCIHHNSLKNLFDSYIKITGLTGKLYNSCFKTLPLLQDFEDKDVNLVNIKNLMDFKSLESTQIYLHVAGKELEESIKVL